MRTPRPEILPVIFIAILFAIGIALKAQTDQGTTDQVLQPLAPGDVPESGAFFRLSDYLANDGSLGPPWPFLMTNAPVYSLDGWNFLVDDAAITNDDQLVKALTLLVQPQDQFSARIMSASSLDPGDGSNTNSSGGWTNNAQYSPFVFPTNALYLTIDGVANGEAYINLINTDTNSVYEVLSAETLGANPLNLWKSEGALEGADGITATKVPTLGRSNLFLTARNISMDSAGQGLPDYWQIQYFGTNGVDPYADPDGDGWNNLEEYLNGTDPTAANVPPPPRNGKAEVDQSGTNVSISWEAGGGPVDHYSIEKGDKDTDTTNFQEIATVSAGTFTYTDGPFYDLRSSGYTAPQYIVRAYFSTNTFGLIHPNGMSANLQADTPRLEVKQQRLGVDMSVVRGPGGQTYLAIGAPPLNLSHIRIIYLEIDVPLFFEFPGFDIDATNLVNGTLLLPQDFVITNLSRNLVWAQAFSKDGAIGDTVEIDDYQGLNEPEMDYVSFDFVDARAYIAENLRFLLRAATKTQPFRYVSDQTVWSSATNSDEFDSPEQWFARASSSTDYEYYGYHFYSPNRHYSVMQDWRPFRDNFMWNNFVYQTNIVQWGGLVTGASYDFDAQTRTIKNPEYIFSDFSNVPPPLNLSTSNWLYYCDYDGSLDGDLAVSDVGLSYDWGNNTLTLDSLVRNCYGLRLLSLRTGNDALVLPNSTFDFVPDYFPNFETPILQTANYYFTSETRAVRAGTQIPPMPGSPDFTVTNTSPLTIASVGEPIVVSAWAKKAILNNYPYVKYAYEEQYLSGAYQTYTNGTADTNHSAGLLSPNGEFLPIVTGKASIITMPDITTGQQSTGAVQVIALTTDVNHDGVIDSTFGGPDFTSESRPFRFWVNDNYDRDDDYGDGIPGNKTKRNLWPGDVDDWIDGTRDLTDFFPVFVDIRGLLQSQSSLTNLTFIVSQADNALYSIGTDLTPTNCMNYLRDTNVATSIAYARTGRIEDDGPFGDKYVLGTNFLRKIRDDGKGIILVEASKPTTAPLVLEVWQGTNQIARASLYLSISPVEQMFRHKNLLFNTAGTNGFPFADRLTAADVPNEPDTNDKNFVFVHGYNVNPDHARGNATDIFKRLYWSGSHAKFYAVTWFGYDTQGNILPYVTANYHTNVVHAFETAPLLANFLDTLTNGSTVVAGHSLGNMVTLSALSDWNARMDKFFMIDAAVPLEAVQGSVIQTATMADDDWVEYNYRLYAHDWYKLFPTNDARSTLAWNGRLSNFRSTDVYNFYSSGEEVLRDFTGDPPTDLLSSLIPQIKAVLAGAAGRSTWVWGEKAKGIARYDDFLGSTHGGWRLNRSYFPDHDVQHLDPLLANVLPDSELQTNSFFNFDTSNNSGATPHPDLMLLTSNGSAYAQTNRNRILADAIPSLTLPIGANIVPRLTQRENTVERNFDMQELYQNGWPDDRMANRQELNNWHHSDFRIVAYTFTHPLFDAFVMEGSLK